ncbi:hypothetical protein AAHB34_05315 [Paenarthrobacter ureafaciens]
MEIADLSMVEPTQSKLRLTDLWEKATGGGDVAARPGSRSSAEWPSSPRPAGVAEAVRWFENAVDMAEIPAFLFLVGGPGAGKSDTTSHLVRNFKEIDVVNDGLAHRSYIFETGARKLRLINDATIDSLKYATAPLVHEITQAAKSSEHFVACVNRGVLVDELLRVGQATSDNQAGILACQWLQSKKPTIAEGSEWQLTACETDDADSYLRSAELSQNGEVRAVIVAVFLDHCSLLERRPESHAVEESRIPDTGRYVVSPFSQRSRIAPTAIPAGYLLNAVIESLEPDAGETFLPNHLNPFAANLRSLRIPRIQQGLLSILRAAEISSGQRFTYREVWGGSCPLHRWRSP